MWLTAALAAIGAAPSIVGLIRKEDDPDLTTTVERKVDWGSVAWILGTVIVLVVIVFLIVKYTRKAA